MPIPAVLFSKYPEPGKVKTRLCPPLTEEQASQLARAFILDMADKIRSVPTFEPWIAFDPEESKSDFVKMLPGFKALPQGEGDLGKRLRRTFHQVSPALIVGPDHPELGSEVLQELAQSLDDHDAAFVPTLDGGYAAIALRAPCNRLFKDIPWSTPGVLKATLAACQEENFRVRLLPAVYDVDRPEDLEKLQKAYKERPQLIGGHTGKVLNDFLT